MRAEQVTEPIAFHGEGPVWSERWGGLRWVDMLAGDILSLEADGSVGRRHVGKVVAALRPRRKGGAVLALERGFALEDPDGTRVELAELWSDETVRMNEGACDPDGRFYAGSMAYDQRPGAGNLYRLDPDRSIHLVRADVTISNGLDFSPDAARAYYVDTATRRITVFDYDRDAGLTGGRTFAEIPADAGRPDGLTVDAEGGVWVALTRGSAVRHYRPDGVLDGVVAVPALKVTACTFGGPGLDELYITTSKEGIDASRDPLAGALFRASVGVVGLPVREFAG
jgi:sugar lactone lactonase YvrE